MKKLILLLVFLIPAELAAQAPKSTVWRVVSTLPATCDPASGEILYRNAGNTGVYVCIQNDKWRRIDSTAIWDVTAFGADPFGLLDSYTAIQAAITAAQNASGGYVILPYGVFKLSHGLVLTGAQEIHLVGAGWGNNVTATPPNSSGSVLYNTSTDPCITIGTVGTPQTADIYLQNFRISYGTGAGAHGVLINDIHNMTVSNIRVERVGGDGIHLDQAYAMRVYDSYISNCTGSGLWVNQLNDFLLAIGNRFLANGAAGIHLTQGGTHGHRIENNDFEGNVTGILGEIGGGLGGIETLAIKGNYFESQTGKNISLGEDAVPDFYKSPVIENNQFNAGVGGAAVNSVVIDRCILPRITGNSFNASNLVTTVRTVDFVIYSNNFSGSTFPTGGQLNLSNGGFLIRSDTAGQADIGTSSDWALRFFVNNASRWQINNSANYYLAGPGMTLTATPFGGGLPAATNGTILYCSDCDPVAAGAAPVIPCTSAGARTGALAVRINGAWKCY